MPLFNAEKWYDILIGTYRTPFSRASIRMTVSDHRWLSKIQWHEASRCLCDSWAYSYWCNGR